MTSRTLLVERLLSEGAGVGPLLGIDTGSSFVSLGIIADGRIKASLNRLLPSHCAGLPGAVDEVLTSAGIGIRELAGVAVGIGPGSFTGLRIGLSYAKGIVTATGLALVGVPSLDAMALVGVAEVDTGWIVCPVLDARRGEVYVALYRIAGDALEKLGDDRALPADEIPVLVSDQVIFVGDAGAALAHQRTTEAGGRSQIVNRSDMRGAMIAACGAASLARGERREPATLEPRYVGSRAMSTNSTAERGERCYGTSRGRIIPALCRP